MIHRWNHRCDVGPTLREEQGCIFEYLLNNQVLSKDKKKIGNALSELHRGPPQPSTPPYSIDMAPGSMTGHLFHQMLNSSQGQT